ncbi:MAG TPA: DsrE family protein [Usitatibacter sp.]|nr:DsrE family protein [Usitatibacter sp.]
MQTSLRRIALAAILSLAWSACALADASSKVVYHVDEGLEKAAAALRNVSNHLEAEPGAKIVVVTHGPGIDFLLDGAKDKNGNPFEVMVETLQAKGVEFRVCNNTLMSRKIDPKKVISQATIVPSGVAEIGRLQAKEGYVYLKP